MKINTATAYQALTPLINRIRSEAVNYERMIVHVRNLLPGDQLVEGGGIVRQMFDHIFGDVELPTDSVLVQFTQVNGLSVVTGTPVVEIFRPVQP